MFAAMMKKLMYPAGRHAIACAGKGGNQGGKYIMERARQMLIEQGHDGDRTSLGVEARGTSLALCPLPLAPCLPPSALKEFAVRGPVRTAATICMVGDRFDTDVRAGLSAGFLTCLVNSGCHSIDCQQFYRTDPVHFHAADVGALVPHSTRPAMSVRVSASFRPPSTREAAMALQAWMLQHSSVLKPAGGVASLRATLRPVLQSYFEAIDVVSPPASVLSDPSLPPLPDVR